MKVSQARGSHLDRMVAVASGKKFTTLGWAPVMISYMREDDGSTVQGWEEFAPSTKWEQGGPLIHEAGISISYLRQYNRWVAMSTEGEGYFVSCSGSRKSMADKKNPDSKGWLSDSSDDYNLSGFDYCRG